MSLQLETPDHDRTGFQTHSLAGATGAEPGGGTTDKPVLTLDEVAYQLTHGYWQSTNGDWRKFDVTAGDTLTVNIDGLDATGQETALQALAAWTAVSGLQFQTTSGPADITFDDEYAGAYASSSIYTSINEIASASINIHPSWQDYGQYYFQTFMHEIGHALGLGHGGSYNGNGGYEADAHYANDSWQMSVMSYFSQWENTYVDATHNYLATPQMADILAIQALYGTADVNAGATVYGDNTTLTQLGMNLPETWAVTLHDSGGVDVIDLGSRSHDQHLSLLSETWSDLHGQIGNFGIARGTVIENAITGSGNDAVTGNAADNEISTGAGADTLEGGGGDDTLAGGAGEDIAIYQGAPGDYSLTFDGADLILAHDAPLADQGTDRLRGIEELSFTDGYTGRVENDGTRTTVRFYDDASALTSSLVVLDVADNFSWYAFERTFVDGERATQTNYYDNGRVLSASYLNGQRESLTVTDTADVYIWTSYTDTYDSDGTRLSRVQTQDDGRIIETHFDDGATASILVTDGGNIAPWHSIESIYDPQGELVRRVQILDNELIQQVDFSGSQRTEIKVIDAGDIRTWDSVTHRFDTGGALTERETVLDDGRIVTHGFTGGGLTSLTITDGADAFVWTSLRRDLDANGNLDFLTETFDDGRIGERDYVDGIISGSVLTDAANAFAWQSITETYDSTGTLVERVTAWDNGSEDVVTFSDTPLV